MSHPYHGHKHKQETGIALEVSKGYGRQVSDAAKCEIDLAFVEFGTFRIDAACKLANPERQRGLKSWNPVSCKSKPHAAIFCAVQSR
jgi:hypothetical protein